MAINLATRFQKKVMPEFFLQSFTKGNFSNEYSWDGSKTIEIPSIATQPLTNYDRTATGSRYGPMQEVQDTKDVLTITQDMAFKMAIDKGNNVDQEHIKEAARVMKLQMREQVIPAFDTYALEQLAANAGNAGETTATAAKNNIVGLVMDAATAMTEAKVPMEKRLLYITATVYNFLRQAPEFLAADSMDLSGKALAKGQVGYIADMKVIVAPTSYFPEKVQFIAAYRDAAIMPFKIQDTRIITNSENVNGAILVGRFYYDCFVFEKRKSGVYVSQTA